MELRVDLEAVQQILCKQCGGIESMYYKNKEVDWDEALVKFTVAVDAWCIC